MLVMGSRAYGSGRFDAPYAMKWLEQNVRGDPNVLIIRTENAVLCCLVMQEFLCPQRLYADVPLIIGMDHVWEAIRLVRVAKQWAKTRGAKRFIMSSDEDMPDVGPIARRIGLRPYQAAYQGDL